MEDALLKILWYAVVGCAIGFYTILDGFDLGVGAIHLFARKDQDRRVFINAIGPVWDGNEVWLVIIIGALFAGFPDAYASIFSGFYSLFMILIAGLMFRASAIEFRSKREGALWRNFWDVVFCFSSIVVAFVLGMTLGNLVEGIPMNAYHDFDMPFWSFFRPYSVLIGITAVALFTMHGNIFLVMKTEGEIHEKLRKAVIASISIFFAFYILTTIVTLVYKKHMIDRMIEHPFLFIIPAIAFITILSIPFHMAKQRDGWAFLSSCMSILLLVLTYCLGTFPMLVRSSIDPFQNSLTIYNSASSDYTLTILLIIVLLGLPLVLGYGYWIYRIFKGKVQLNHMSY